MATPLIINAEVRANIAKLKRYAGKNRVTYEQLEMIANGTLPPPGDNENYQIAIPMGFKVVYTQDQFPLKNKTGYVWFHHISISSLAYNRCPNNDAIDMILQEFGMPMLSDVDMAYREEEERAINVIARIV